MLSKNTRSGKVREIANQHDWQYQEFIEFSDTIKIANFGILNYSQNAIFRHAICANAQHFGLGFNFLDCRAIEASGIHNSSVLLFNLTLNKDFSHLHCSITPNIQASTNHHSSALNNNHLAYIRKKQKLITLESHHAFENQTLHANDPELFSRFLQLYLTDQVQNNDSQQNNPSQKLNTWLLAHPHLHIEISNGILLAYQPNHLLADDSILPAINAVAALSKSISSST
jgi:hypothetical protein